MDNNDTKINDADIDLTADESIDLFIEGIMEEKGVAEQSDELKQDIFADLKTRLLEEIDRSLVAALPDEKLEELSRAVEENGKVEPETVANMVAEAGIDTEEVVGVTMARFRELYLGENPDAAEAEAIEDTKKVEADAGKLAEDLAETTEDAEAVKEDLQNGAE